MMKPQSLTCCDDALFSNRLAEIVSRYPKGQVFLLCDSGSLRYCLDHLPIDHSHFQILEIPSGETFKSIESLQKVWRFLIENGASRSSVLLNLGGGMICDLGGFAASTFMRGIDFVHIPTTLLAMVDASIGGKNGIDFSDLKNSIGCINMPKDTLVWPKFLATLPPRQLLSGYSEMLKHALLKSESAWERISVLNPYSIGDESSILDLLQESTNVKIQLVQSDVNDFDKRQALNFGHTIGHALESLSLLRSVQHPNRQEGKVTLNTGEALPHGYAVAYGMICELYISTKLTGFPRESLMQVLYKIKEAYPSYPISCKDYPLLMDEMRHDKKNGGPSIRMTLLSDFGIFRTGQALEEKIIMESLDFFQEFMN